ncbi:MHO_1590 family protein [Candidatus Mycoplasma mahonii]|uniref:MHO_1590 family protein n=1 Tax=Candidatus Mycoplasma mahonii TaxID=3004105 RepID=UPI0026ED02C6|nr:hypothetical protein [Candidatus Mycoplasma mahonii]WKX02686.1 hypothetical protein O3I44_01255 [Candidatus Mycoplasma mahonii]
MRSDIIEPQTQINKDQTVDNNIGNNNGDDSNDEINDAKYTGKYPWTNIEIRKIDPNNNDVDVIPSEKNTEIVNIPDMNNFKNIEDLKKSAKKNYDKKKKTKNDDLFQVFPVLSGYDFYKYIIISKSGAESLFTDKFIAAVIKKVVTEMNITQGVLKWGFERVSSSILDIKFSWVTPKPEERIYSKTYHFTLDIV